MSALDRGPDATHVELLARVRELEALADCQTTLAARTAAVLNTTKRQTELEREVAELKKAYHELLYAVGNKYPGESRHQTALRYLQRAEQNGSGPASERKAT